MEENKVFLGSDLKLNVSITTEGWHMSDGNWKIEAWCNPRKKYIVNWDNPNEVFQNNDNDNYIIIIPTDEIGTGSLKLKAIVELPDGDLTSSTTNNGDAFNPTRTEVVSIPTDIKIVELV